MKSKLILLLIAGAFLFHAPSSLAQTSVTRQYRGSITGTYAYDRVGQEIKLSGSLSAEGKLELTEFGEKNKPTGKFSCKQPFDDPVDRECYWSKPDGTGESFVSLNEQNLAFTGGIQLVPKLITNRARGIVVSYPQLAGTGTLSAAAQKFNRRILAMTQKAISEFEPVDGKGSLDTNYTVQLGTNDLVSVEMMEFSDGGGAHPNDRWWALTYDLAADKELKYDDLFKPGSDYNTAIAKYLTDDINRRAIELEKDNARRENRQPTTRNKSITGQHRATTSAFRFARDPPPQCVAVV